MTSAIRSLCTVSLALAAVIAGPYPLCGATVHDLARQGADMALENWLRHHPGQTDLRDGGNWTPLHHAAFRGNRSTSDLLIAAGADVNARDSHGLTPLDLAAIRNHHAVVALLLKENAAVPAKEDIFNNISGSTAPSGFHPHLSEYLKNTYTQSPEGELHAAAKLLEQVMQERESLNHPPPGTTVHTDLRRPGTGLHRAAITGDIDGAKRYIARHPAWVNRSDEYGITPLHFAAVNGYYRICRLLLEAGASPSARTLGGITPLYGAVSEGRSRTARLLIQWGADVRSPTADGAEPLHSASTGEVARLLIENGAEVMAKNDHGFTPLHSACNSGYLDVGRTLIEKGASVDEPNRYGWTPLMEAVYGNHPQMVILLIEAGVDLNQRTESGSTALHVAIILERTAVADILRRHGAVI